MILERSLLIDNSNPDDIKILPYFEVVHATLGVMLEPRDLGPLPSSTRGTAAKATGTKVITGVRFVQRSLYENQRFDHNGNAGKGMQGSVGSSDFGIV